MSATSPPVTDDGAVGDLAICEVTPGTRVLVVSDLHLAWRATEASLAVTAELANTLDAWTGPGIVILNGDVFELLLDPQRDPGRILDAHPRLESALHRFASVDGRRLLVVPGNHDGALAWDADAAAALTRRYGASIVFAVELHIAAGEGTRIVRVEHGNRFDHANTFTDPRNPADTPIGHHVVTDVLPQLDQVGWLDGLADLADPRDAPAFIASRLAYRRVARQLWWLVIPFLMAFTLVLAFVLVDIVHPHDRATGLLSLSGRLAILGALITVDVVLVGLLLVVVMRRAFRSMADIEVGYRSSGENDDPRSAAEAAIRDGAAGFVTSHTHQPELTKLAGGFYANTGSGGVVVRRRRSRLGLPPVFLAERQLSWLELEAGAELHARLLYSRVDLMRAPLVERLVATPGPDPVPRPAVVASVPGDADWPARVFDDVDRRRTRRIAGAIIAAAGLLNIASAITPPLNDRLDVLRDAVPLVVPETASAIVAMSGIALLLLSRGVRRGQRHAWALATGLVGMTAVLHIAKGLDLEETIATVVVLGYLLVNRRAFTASVDRPSVSRAAVTLLAGAATAIVVGTVTALWIPTSSHLSIGRALAATSERLVGFDTIALPAGRDRFLAPTLGAIGIALGATAVWLVFRPVVQHRLLAARDMERARDIVHRYGGDTLAYFALRGDKDHWFHGDTLVAYAVHNGICLVSPDPVGPTSQRIAAWRGFRQYADSKGWAVAVMGASEAWLPTYRATGMHDIYVGDEAVVDANRFSLEGGRMKGLRQAVNRIDKYGYTIEFCDPAEVAPALASKLRRLMTESRRGEVERGFSMTLGRVFAPQDRGLLLAVCYGPDGEPAAFCQYVPADDINGYSLDLMRRSEHGEHWNGLSDFVIVRTIQHLRDHGMSGLGLNFAVMRSVLAHETRDTIGHRIERWMLGWLSESMQIESLWKYNAKFDPDWRPRYAVYDSAEHFLPSALAVAKAESFWELPIIGRFLQPEPDGEPPIEAEVSPTQ